jgi:hypothetical protein
MTLSRTVQPAASMIVSFARQLFVEDENCEDDRG